MPPEWLTLPLDVAEMRCKHPWLGENPYVQRESLTFNSMEDVNGSLGHGVRFII